MIRIRPLPLLLAVLLGIGSATSFAATDTNTDSRPQTDQQGGKTAGEGSSINSPGSGQDNDSSNTGTDADDGAAGGSNSTGEATGSGAGHSGGTAEDQDSH
ncbi:hypothetical protein [Pseudomonas sp. PSKL.D1]|uniref:hypothetical protein n=1 Tax=Pseudomonas sp. PSKL.D1 TaxID=3029060 RepID=UPI00238170BA|nr:hypothetical protein [Pseudomonas sp. PSKL.D1]WDY55648.1 hypothetical protein PVV54_13590 [Pseudomonas sp. PSKL.D1]